jgi:hypothetical protein
LSSSIKFVILSEAKDLLFARVTTADPGLCIENLLFRSLLENTASSGLRAVLFTGERSEHTTGEGTTQAMHYRASSEGRAFC